MIKRDQVEKGGWEKDQIIGLIEDAKSVIVALNSQRIEKEDIKTVANFYRQLAGVYNKLIAHYHPDQDAYFDAISQGYHAISEAKRLEPNDLTSFKYFTGFWIKNLGLYYDRSKQSLSLSKNIEFHQLYLSIAEHIPEKKPRLAGVAHAIARDYLKLKAETRVSDPRKLEYAKLALDYAKKAIAYVESSDKKKYEVELSLLFNAKESYANALLGSEPESALILFEKLKAEFIESRLEEPRLLEFIFRGIGDAHFAIYHKNQDVTHLEKAEKSFELAKDYHMVITIKYEKSFLFEKKEKPNVVIQWLDDAAPLAKLYETDQKNRILGKIFKRKANVLYFFGDKEGAAKTIELAFDYIFLHAYENNIVGNDIFVETKKTAKGEKLNRELDVGDVYQLYENRCKEITDLVNHQHQESAEKTLTVSRSFS